MGQDSTAPLGPWFVPPQTQFAPPAEIWFVQES